MYLYRYILFLLCTILINYFILYYCGYYLLSGVVPNLTPGTDYFLTISLTMRFIFSDYFPFSWFLWNVFAHWSSSQNY